MPSPSVLPVHNRLLAALPPRDYAKLRAHLEPVELGLTESLQVPGEPLRYVYFPTGAVTVLVGQVDQRPPLAVSLIGTEGLVGLPVFLGARTTRWGTQVHLAGAALRLSAEVLRQICRQEGPLPAQLRHYTDTLLAQVIQSAACGRFHPLPARLACWLLMTDDRSEADTLSLTHQTLAELLGVRREAVSNAAGVLQNQRLIGYRRGLLQIFDRVRLESIACTCYHRHRDTG
jgi:CRP-like cAMP-binding protein